jgi:antitoxin YefM
MEVYTMSTISISELRKDIYNIIKGVTKSHEPLTVTSRNAADSAVIINQKDWEDIQETLFLYSHKDSRETIIKSLEEPIDKGVEIDWKNGG